jgi:hypothetical protein
VRGRTLAVALVFAPLILAQSPRASAEPPSLSIGPVNLEPSGFLDLIGGIRSKSSSDTVSTRFASVPLGPDETQIIASPDHSRIALHGDTRLWKGTLTGYIEADFLQPRGQTPWRWRQFWGEYRIGKWRVLGGQGWSLLRPNRTGLSSESALMNTLVIEPAYHVGLLGLRHEQVRLTYDMTSNSHAAVEYESGGKYLAKFAQDRRKGFHWEAIGFAGTRGRRGAAMNQIVPIRPWLRVAGEIGYGRGLGPEALGILPRGPDALTVLEGVEMPLKYGWMLWAYGGFARAGRRTLAPDNRLEQQWTAGARKVVYRGQFGSCSIGVQASQIARSVWDGRQGSLTYYMGSLRFELPKFGRS